MRIMHKGNTIDTAEIMAHLEFDHDGSELRMILVQIQCDSVKKYTELGRPDLAQMAARIF
mgnify:CR=1 FL=1